MQTDTPQQAKHILALSHTWTISIQDRSAASINNYILNEGEKTKQKQHNHNLSCVICSFGICIKVGGSLFRA